MIEFTDKDIKRQLLIEPGFYRVRVDNYEPKMAKSGKSMNHNLEGTILFHGDTGSTKFAGCPTPGNWFFNDGAIGQAIPLFESVLGRKIVAGDKVGFEGLKGREIDMWIANGEYQGKMQNQVNHTYRKIREDVVAVSEG